MDGRSLRVTERTRLRRAKEKASLSRDDLHAVLTSGYVCHLAFVSDGAPVALPTVYGFVVEEELLYLHGSVASRSLVASPEQTVCVTVTHVDGLVLARSVFEHSVNYRCAMVFGVPRVVTDEGEIVHGLRALSEQAAPGQWDYVRRPSGKEIAATTLLALTLDEASVKLSASHPDDGDGPDADLAVWAGKLPLHHVWGTPVADPALRAGTPVPDHIAARTGTRTGSV